ncbi:MAG: ATP-binding protein [Desulfomonilia bacterium]|jgi:PAS domain S-box-containing protein|nr:ATP-binding protein [Deltaproteobacteria bacterium]MDX9762586.1 ATP-binding protein [Desulfomonilia bacterium]HPW69197.1 ATP-binding protein [Deltaproteobacteria bacterium]
MQEKSNMSTVLDRFISPVRETMGSMISPVYIKDADLRYVWLNRSYADMIALSALEHAVGKTEGDFFPSPAARELASAENRVLDKGASIRETLKDISCPDGVSRSFVRTLDPLSVNGSPVGLLGILTEIPSPGRMPDECQEQETFFEDFFINATAMAAITDRRGDILKLNRKAREMFLGKTSMVQPVKGRNILEFIHEEDKQKVVKLWKESIQRKKEVNYQIRMISHDGRVLYMLISGRPIIKNNQVISFQYQALDMIDQKIQERNLLHSASVETLGQMAGGFAHDFKNILTVINGYSEMMLRSMDKSHPFYGKMFQICQAGTQASMLTQKILEFSSKNRPEPKEIDIDQEMTDQEAILRHVIEENIKLSVQRSAGVKKILIDPTQFAKVLLNLVINAKEAMPSGGEITITTEALDIDESLAQQYDNIRPGRYLCLCVSDTGSGMSEEVRQHVFDPFFTTRETGKGVGLWIVNSIVKDYQGRIQVESAEGKGTTFRILLPFSGEDRPLAEEAPQEPARCSKTTGKTILVVEDDDTVRELVNEILKHCGHHVLTACNGGDALQLARQYEGTIDLLITDMVMRRIDGIMLSKKMRTILPDIRVVLMSGYGEDVIRQEDLKDIAFLQKPFLPDDLIEKVDTVLSNPA